MPLLATALLLGIVMQTMGQGPGIAARVARLAGGRTRASALYGWALGTAVTFCAPALLALALIGRVDAVWAMPAEFGQVARAAGWRGAIDGEAAWLLGSLGLGAAIGLAVLLVRRALGRAPMRVIHRSAAAARHASEWGGAAAIAVAAGVSEELFFRLALPLAIGLATGSVVAGLAVATIAFALIHRHQGWKGVAATGVVGAGLAYLYLSTGALWVAMLLHVAIDLNALILRPWLDRPLRRA